MITIEELRAHIVDMRGWSGYDMREVLLEMIDDSDDVELNEVKL